MFVGRFFLGVGTGENLNEHILGDRWPPTDVRLEMLEEAVVVVMCLLWQGGQHSQTAGRWPNMGLPDPEPYVDSIHAEAQAGYDRVYFHDVGPDQHGFITFLAEEVVPQSAS